MLFVAFTTTLKVFNSYQPTSNFEIKDKLKRATRLTGSDSKRMSLLWNWGSRNFLRRSMPYSSSMQAQFPKIASRSLSQSLSLPIVPSSSPLVTPLPMYYLWTPMRGVKTHSGCKKRFRVRGSGSIKR